MKKLIIQCSSAFVSSVAQRTDRRQHQDSRDQEELSRWRTIYRWCQLDNYAKINDRAVCMRNALGAEKSRSMICCGLNGDLLLKRLRYRGFCVLLEQVTGMWMTN